MNFNISETSFDGENVEFTFEVKDTGIGMNPEFISHIFDAFSQENGGSRAKYQGTGLGMSITKQLVELMDGTIDVESEPGKGSCFTVKIKYQIDTAAPSKNTVSKVSLEGTKVLLAEDNELNMEIAQTILDDNGIIVTPAINGRDALEKFKSNPPGTFDIILMDIMMPEMNGYDATKAIRKLDREDAASIPILAMTANAFDEDKRLAHEAGMNSHISKPIHVPTMLEEINRFIK